MRILFNALLIVLVIAWLSTNVYGQKNANQSTGKAIKIESHCFKNLWKLNDTIFRSEQPGRTGFVYLDSIGIRSVLNLRLKHDKKELIGKFKLNEFNVEMKAKSFGDSQVIKAMKVLMQAPKPVLVHCKYGSDRTGLVIAMYRIIFQNWTKEQAINEMRDGGYGFHEWYSNIPDYLEKVDIERIKKLLNN